MDSAEAMSARSIAFDLRHEIHKKLGQANGICIAISSFGSGFDRSIGNSLWAVTDLIQNAKKAVDELYQQSTSAEKEVQS